MPRPTKQALAKRGATSHPSGIPLWVKQALTQMVLEDKEPKTIAKRMGRSEATIKAYALSPAGEEWINAIKAASNDPREFTRTHLGSLVLNVATDLLWALELAKDREDYGAIRQITQWLLERPEMLGAVSKESAPTITINIGNSASLEPQMIESSHAEAKIEGLSVEGEWEPA